MNHRERAAVSREHQLPPMTIGLVFHANEQCLSRRRVCREPRKTGENVTALIQLTVTIIINPVTLLNGGHPFNCGLSREALKAFLRGVGLSNSYTLVINKAAPLSERMSARTFLITEIKGAWNTVKTLGGYSDAFSHHAIGYSRAGVPIITGLSFNACGVRTGNILFFVQNISHNLRVEALPIRARGLDITWCGGSILSPGVFPSLPLST